ncbi:MAG: response regulator [Desulfonatronospira sp. MSAO_Bac3]|nr:MAG: response regulator [Desulfonatronospira sp. MSAO_Bac3]
MQVVADKKSAKPVKKLLKLFFASYKKNFCAILVRCLKNGICRGLTRNNTLLPCFTAHSGLPASGLQTGSKRVKSMAFGHLVRNTFLWRADRMKVLIAEDEFYNRWVLSKMMASYGNCIETDNGEEAVQTFCWACRKKEPYDLVLLDIMMPALNGFEVLERIRAFEKESGIENLQKTKIVMLTSLEEPEYIDQALNEYGADSYLTKPVQLETLRQVLTDLGFFPQELDMQQEAV